MSMSADACAARTISQFRGEWGFLSNFFQCVVTLDGIDYPSGEHAFQAQKTEDVMAQRRMAAASTSAEAKRLGRSVPLIGGWNEWRRYAAMERVIEAKFSPGRRLTEQLCDTGDAVLIEGNNWHDNTWGVCVCQRCEGKGHNLLGWMLMRRRALMRDVTAFWRQRL